MDSHNHLFLSYEYSMEIWEEIRLKIKRNPISSDWPDIVEYLVGTHGVNKIWNVLRIISDVRLKLQSLKVKMSKDVQEVAALWDIK
ncbi:hypothetical protein Tco_0020816 [Tanacetum coccineum]